MLIIGPGNAKCDRVIRALFNGSTVEQASDLRLRWLLRFVSNETLADDMSEVFSRCVASGGSLPIPLLRLDVVNGDCSP